MLSDMNVLWQPVSGVRKRASSFDRSGGNKDYVWYSPGERKVVMESSGCAGLIMRIWSTLYTEDPEYLTNIKIRLTFDGLVTADDIPFGMLLATGPWRVNDLVSPPMTVMRCRQENEDNPDPGRGSFNINWPMPFAKSAKVELFNDSEHRLMHHYYIEYCEELDVGADPLLFHATHRVEKFTKRTVVGANVSDLDMGIEPTDDEPKNPSNKLNYKFADIQNYTGRYVGTVLTLESHPDRHGKWYEGDDMFFIDGEEWPPSLHGTGSEDYFGMAWGVNRPFQSFNHGVTHWERNITDHDNYYDGRFTLYRWHLTDPIGFHKSLHASIESGHANDCEQYYESVAFWYGRPI
jgi:D-arabinan exo alpha-(1,3)/(1,5)-arabinofuranosidase (non-reducing end)